MRMICENLNKLLKANDILPPLCKGSKAGSQPPTQGASTFEDRIWIGKIV